MIITSLKIFVPVSSLENIVCYAVPGDQPVSAKLAQKGDCRIPHLRKTPRQIIQNCNLDRFHEKERKQIIFVLTKTTNDMIDWYFYPIMSVPIFSSCYHDLAGRSILVQNCVRVVRFVVSFIVAAPATWSSSYLVRRPPACGLVKLCFDDK